MLSRDPLDGPTAGDAQTPRASAALRLVRIGEAAQLVHDDRGEGYAAVVDGKAQRILRIRSRGFRQWLAGAYYVQTGRAASGEALETALNVLEAKALYRGPRCVLWNRFARTDDAVWLDLADEGWRAARVTAEGWSIVNEPPILFRRYSHQAPLPEPERGGDARAILAFLNVARDDAPLVVVALVTALLADIPRPVVVLHGPQGSAKTTAARMLRAVVDPSVADTLDLQRDPAELAQVLDHHGMPVFDNIGRLAPWQSDALCRAVTGAGFQKRALYTDAEDVLLSFKRPILLTGITVPTSQPDLLDRCLLVGLERVPAEQRREEGKLWTAFGVARPGILGGLLDAIAGALRLYPTVRLSRPPRMADFARWGAAVAEALGYGAGPFLDALHANTGRQTEEALEGDPVAEAVRALVQESGEWTGTATELLGALSARRRDVVKGDGWPRRARDLSARLHSLQTPLAHVGVDVGFSRSHHPRLITLAAGDADSASPASLGAASRAAPWRGWDAGGDARDPGGQPASPLTPFPDLPGGAGDAGDADHDASVRAWSPVQEQAARVRLLDWGRRFRWPLLAIGEGRSIPAGWEAWTSFAMHRPAEWIGAALAATGAGGGNGEVGAETRHP